MNNVELMFPYLTIVILLFSVHLQRLPVVGSFLYRPSGHLPLVEYSVLYMLSGS